MYWIRLLIRTVYLDLEPDFFMAYNGKKSQTGVIFSFFIQKKKYVHDALPVAKFIVPDRGILSTPAYCCRTGPPAYVAGRAGTTTLCRSQLYPSVRDYELDYWFPKAPLGL
jgi:hypothetical protein